MYAMKQIKQAGRRPWRKHSPDFKAELVLSYQQTCVSMAAIAMAHGINPNLLRRWITEHERLGHHEAPFSSTPRRDVVAQLIPLLLARSEAVQIRAKVSEETAIELEQAQWP